MKSAYIPVNGYNRARTRVNSSFTMCIHRPSAEKSSKIFFLLLLCFTIPIPVGDRNQPKALGGEYSSSESLFKETFKSGLFRIAPIMKGAIDFDGNALIWENDIKCKDPKILFHIYFGVKTGLDLREDFKDVFVHEG